VTPERELDPGTLGDHLDRLYRAAWALCGSREEAEDLVQETYVRVLAKPRLIRSEDDLGYLLRVLRNTFLTGLETKGRRPRTAAMSDEVEQLMPERRATGPEEALEARQVYGAIAQLPAAARDVLVAVDVAGLSYKEAARLLGVRKGTIMSRLHRARAQVARNLEAGVGETRR
jgi:RNA polymerase sigma-70 factor, ECF subfamily